MCAAKPAPLPQLLPHIRQSVRALVFAVAAVCFVSVVDVTVCVLFVLFCLQVDIMALLFVYRFAVPSRKKRMYICKKLFAYGFVFATLGL